MESRTIKQGEPAESGDRPSPGRRPACGEVRCVVALSKRAASAPSELMRSLAQRGVNVCERRDPYAAMAALMESKQVGSATALIVVDPDAFTNDDARKLTAAAKRYAPKAALRRYDSAGENRLRPLTETPQPEPPAAPAPQHVEHRGSPMETNNGPENGPALRLTPNEPAEAFERAHRAAETSPSPASQLTEEELAMLLSDQPPAPPAQSEQNEQTDPSRSYQKRP